MRDRVSVMTIAEHMDDQELGFWLSGRIGYSERYPYGIKLVGWVGKLGGLRWVEGRCGSIYLHDPTFEVECDLVELLELL